jgi:hypothetical protein
MIIFITDTIKSKTVEEGLALTQYCLLFNGIGKIIGTIGMG